MMMMIGIIISIVFVVFPECSMTKKHLLVSIESVINYLLFHLVIIIY